MQLRSVKQVCENKRLSSHNIVTHVFTYQLSDTPTWRGSCTRGIRWYEKQLFEILILLTVPSPKQLSCREISAPLLFPKILYSTTEKCMAGCHF